MFYSHYNMERIANTEIDLDANSSVIKKVEVHIPNAYLRVWSQLFKALLA